MYRGEDGENNTSLKRGLYRLILEEDGNHPGSKYVSVTEGPVNEGLVNLHSTACTVPLDSTPTLFEQVMASHPNKSLWTDLGYDGAEEWIREGLCRGSITFACDSSYMEKIDPGVSMLCRIPDRV